MGKRFKGLGVFHCSEYNGDFNCFNFVARDLTQKKKVESSFLQVVSQHEYPVKMSRSYTVHIDYTEFREYLVENDDAGPWGDTYFHEVFDEYVEDNSIEIEYKYGDYKDGKTTILWRLAAEEGKGKVYRVRYGGSSRFAMWWCGLTDDLEDEIDGDEETEYVYAFVVTSTPVY